VPAAAEPAAAELATAELATAELATAADSAIVTVLALPVIRARCCACNKIDNELS
jgi:hypothetical protein